MCLCSCAGFVQRAQLFKVSERERGRESQVCCRDVSWLSGMKWRLIQAPWREAIMSVHFPAAPLWAAITSHRCLDWADHITGLERSHKVGAEGVFALGVCMLFFHHLFVKTFFKFIWCFANILCLHTIRQRVQRKWCFYQCYLLPAHVLLFSNLFLLMIDLQTGINHFPWSLYMQCIMKAL